MIRLFITLSCLLLVLGCRSAPKSAKTINGATGRSLFYAIADYSATVGHMPPNLYALDFAGFRTGGHQTTIADLRSVSPNRKIEADFMYFGEPVPIDALDPNKVVIASPFPASADSPRLIMRADGSSEFLNETDFQKAMKKAEMATPRKPSDQF